MRVLLLIVDHGPFEELVNKLLPTLAHDTNDDDLLIYWENLHRFDHTTDNLALGLEDPVLTGLLQLVVFYASFQDERVHTAIEKGVGLKKNKRPTTVPLKALIAARGATSISDLRKIMKEFPKEMQVLIQSINTKELVERRHDVSYVSSVSSKLENLLIMLLNWIAIQGSYNLSLNIDDLINALANITPDANVETSEKSATRARAIVRSGRDKSNYQYVLYDAINRVGEDAKVILVVGGAHYAELNALFSKSGISVSVAYLDGRSEVPDEIQVKLFLQECVGDFVEGTNKNEYPLFVD